MNWKIDENGILIPAEEQPFDLDKFDVDSVYAAQIVNERGYVPRFDRDGEY